MEVDGVLWFYATPTSDNRTRTHDEIKDGITRNRKPRKKVIPPVPAPTGRGRIGPGGLYEDGSH